MTTPIPRILLALDGKIDFTNRSNPFGGGSGQQPAELGGPGWKPPGAAAATAKILAWADRKGAKRK